MFLQIHTLTSYSASLINRDDAGLAKRIPFGNATRLRISSQCQKRHWRDELVKAVPEVPDGLRTRSFFTRKVLPALTSTGVPAETAQALIGTLAQTVIDGGVENDGEMSQPVLFGLREADYFIGMAAQAAKAGDVKACVAALSAQLKSSEEKKNISAMSKSAAGLTSSLFGRFVTSDLLARVDAPVHVAHAMTVHAADTEMDYFTVVDDLNRDDEAGAAHANQSELGAGVYYGHVAVDVPLLVSNLAGADARDWRKQDSGTSRRLLDALIRTVASCSPGAKLGSTAPYSRADLVLLETGGEQPRTLANAFLEAVPARGNLMQEAANRMGRQLARIDGMYGQTAEHRSLATTLDATAFAPIEEVSLSDATGTVLSALWR